MRRTFGYFAAAVLALYILTCVWVVGRAATTTRAIDSHREGGVAAPARVRASHPAVSPQVQHSTSAFVINFESSSGSSWLTEELWNHPQVCIIKFEPIDNISLTSTDDHEARLRWLDILWSKGPAVAERSRAASWEAWRAKVLAASVFGQRPIIRQSLDRCNASSIAFGLKARLTRLLNHEETAMQGLRDVMARRGAKIIQLSRRNRMKQALAEYRRLHAGLGQFRVATGSASARQAVDVVLPAFRQSLRAVERSHRLAREVLSHLRSAPTLPLTYEELLADKVIAIRSVAHFLNIAPPSGIGQRADGAPTTARGEPQKVAKATPDRLCDAVSNYAELCAAYRHDERYRAFLEEPCDCMASRD